jgi:peptide/nickel transport system permease protein
MQPSETSVVRVVPDAAMALVPAEDEYDLEAAARRRGFWARLRRERLAMASLAAIALFVLAAALAPWLAPHDPNFSYENGFTALGTPLGSTRQFPLGTDTAGRDVLSRLLFGARVSLTVGLVATALLVVLGVSVGAASGYFGGWIALGGMRLVDIMVALPTIPMAMVVTAVFGPGVATAIIVIAATQWMYTARMVYGMVSALKEREFIVAARAVGVGNRRILVRHIVPHLAPVVITFAALAIPGAILTEAALSYLNAGVPPPTASWGSMIADAQTVYRIDPALMLYPGLALAVLVLAFSLLGDGLNRALEAR